MIKQISKPVSEILKDISAESLVLDVGGGVAPFGRADWVIDYIPFSEVRFDKIKYDTSLRLTKETYVQHDICSREPWPFKNKQFDYCICSHTLEDIRDPLWVCSEIIRVSKAGYIEVPSRLYETTFGVEMKGLAGNSHHHWVIDIIDDTLRFTFKHAQIHFPCVNKNKLIPHQGLDNYLQCVWEDSFSYKENFLGSGQAVFEYYLNKKITEKEKWVLYRKLDPRSFVLSWLSYFKNATLIGKNIFTYINK